MVAPKLIRSKIVLSSLTITFCVLTALLIICYVALRTFLVNSLIQTTRYDLRTSMVNIERNVETLEQMMNWFSISPDVASFAYSSSLTPADRRAGLIPAWNVLNNTSYGNSLYGYIRKLIIGNTVGDYIEVGTDQGYLSDWGNASRALGSKNLVIATDPFIPKSTSKILVLSKALYSDNRRSILGRIYMAIDTSLLSQYLPPHDSGLYSHTLHFVGIGGQAYEVSANGTFTRIDSTGYFPARQPKYREGPADTPLPLRSIERSGIHYTLVTYRGAYTGWYVAQTLPTFQMSQQNTVFLELLFLIAASTIVLIILVLANINRTVNNPIAMINMRLGLVAGGDFSHDPTIEFENELGDIGRGVNYLSRSIKKFVDSKVQQEAQKKALELRMLQSQINPHFLYNTLNSIKWMAAIQKADGIVEIVNSLAVLLKHVAKGTDTLIPLEQEVMLVEEYCRIHRYRSGAVAETRTLFDDEDLKRCRVVKFTLQPLVENALVHGIEPQTTAGTITIHARRLDDRTLCIDVTDDGIGIEPDRLSRILSDDYEPGRESFNKIGLKNVDERLKLTFGDRYGLSIASEKGVYTTVTVTTPFLPDDEAH